MLRSGSLPRRKLISRVLRYCFSPSQIGPSLAGRSLVVAILLFLPATIVLWALLMLLELMEAVFFTPSAVMHPQQRWEAAHDAFGPQPLHFLSSSYVATLGGAVAFCLLATWGLFLESYRAGPVWMAFGRAIRVSMAGFWLVDMLAILGALVFWVAELYNPSRTISPNMSTQVCTLLAAALCFAALVHWFAAAMRSLPAHVSAPAPICEGCGYDLSHEPAGGVCPECGLDLASSLEGGKRRVGSAWEACPGVLTWLGTCAGIILRPSVFYARLRLRGGDAEARRFATILYFVMAPCAAVWVFAIMVRVIGTAPPQEQGGWWFGALVVFAITSGLILAGWGIKRLIAAIVTTGWFLRRDLPDGRWAAKVVAYETAYLCVFCAFNGLLFTSFAVSSRWVQNLEEQVFGHRIHLFGVPPDALLLWLGNLALIGLWLLRYRTILHAIRWSNF